MSIVQTLLLLSEPGTLGTTDADLTRVVWVVACVVVALYLIGIFLKVAASGRLEKKAERPNSKDSGDSGMTGAWWYASSPNSGKQAMGAEGDVSDGGGDGGGSGDGGGGGDGGGD